MEPKGANDPVTTTSDAPSVAMLTPTARPVDRNHRFHRHPPSASSWTTNGWPTGGFVPASTPHPKSVGESSLPVRTTSPEASIATPLPDTLGPKLRLQMEWPSGPSLATNMLIPFGLV